MSLLQRALLTALLALVGCTSSPSASDRNTPRVELRRAEHIDVPFTRLIDFEIESDLAFIDDPGSRIISSPGGTGRRVLSPAGASTTIRLSSLLLGRPFPGRWNLLGVYVTPGEVSSRVRLTLISPSRSVSERVVSVPGKVWSIVWMDIAEVDPDAVSSLKLVIHFPDSPRRVLIDDIVLADNLFRDSAGAGPVSLDVLRSGLKWSVTGEGAGATLPTHHADGARGYRLESLSPLRATFRDGLGVEALVDRRGRVIMGGVMQGEQEAIAHHATPGRVIPVEETAWALRNSVGDSDGDGYDESQGVYRLRARREVVRFSLEARGVPLAWPVIEIDDLPAGEVRATADGVLVQAVERLADGRVRIELPLIVRESAGIEVRVAQLHR